MTPLISRMLNHSFLSGVVAARNTPGHDEISGPKLWTEYEPHPEDLEKLSVASKMYSPTHVEVQSKRSRIDHAEGLISQLPTHHNGRNTWLMNFGKRTEAQQLRAARGLCWVRETEAAETSEGLCLAIQVGDIVETNDGHSLRSGDSKDGR
jgi:hypothetical protein